MIYVRKRISFLKSIYTYDICNKDYMFSKIELDESRNREYRKIKWADYAMETLRRTEKCCKTNAVLKWRFEEDGVVKFVKSLNGIIWNSMREGPQPKQRKCLKKKKKKKGVIEIKSGLARNSSSNIKALHSFHLFLSLAICWFPI